MTLKEKIETLPASVRPGMGNDLVEMTEDIYYYFSQLEQFEVLRIEPTSDSDRMVLAACLTTMEDPVFRIMVTHTWTRDLAFDNEWSQFEETEHGTVFRFLTWEDEYISGEIWFQREKMEGPKP